MRKIVLVILMGALLTMALAGTALADRGGIVGMNSLTTR